jgi:hypothetical protein
VACALLATCLTGCTQASEGAGSLPPAPPKGPADQLVPVVVDTDLGADDLLAVAFLLRSPAVDVQALTIPATGLAQCGTALDVLAGLFEALEVEPVPVACGRTPAGEHGRAFPAAWRTAAAGGWGIEPRAGALTAEDVDATELLARHARRDDGLVVVALGPLTDVADLAREDPEAYGRLAGVHAMAGSVSGPLVDGVAEWNAAADPESLAAVLDGPVPVTVVPEDAVPEGTPAPLRAPVVQRVTQAGALPAWWDLAAVAALVDPALGRADRGGWAVSTDEPGRLLPAPGRADARVYRTLDGDRLEELYAAVFTPASPDGG